MKASAWWREKGKAKCIHGRCGKCGECFRTTTARNAHENEAKRLISEQLGDIGAAGRYR